MAALTSDFKYQTRAGAHRDETYKLAANVKIWNGATVAFNAAGYIVPASDAAALTVAGIAQSRVDNTGGAAGDKEVNVLTCCRVTRDNAGGAVTIASLGKPVYVADDHSVTTAAVATNDLLCGILDCIDEDGLWVFIDLAINATA